MQGKIKKLEGYTGTSLNIKSGSSFKDINPVELGKYTIFNQNNLATNGVHINLESENINDAVNELYNRVSTKGRKWEELTLPSQYASLVAKVTGYVEYDGYLYITALANGSTAVKSYLFKMSLNGGTFTTYTNNKDYYCDICKPAFSDNLHICAFDTENAYEIRVSPSSMSLVYNQLSILEALPTTSNMLHSYVVCDDRSIAYMFTISATKSFILYKNVDVNGNYIGTYIYKEESGAFLKRPVNLAPSRWLYSVGDITGGQANRTTCYILKDGNVKTTLASYSNTALCSCFNPQTGVFYIYVNSDKVIKKFDSYTNTSNVVATNIDMPINLDGLSIFDYAYINGKHVYSMVDKADNKVKLWYAINPFSANRYTEVMPTEDVPLYDFRQVGAVWIAKDISNSNKIYITK